MAVQSVQYYVSPTLAVIVLMLHRYEKSLMPVMLVSGFFYAVLHRPNMPHNIF